MKPKKQQTIKPPRGVNIDKSYQSKYKGVARYVHSIHGWVWYSARVGTDFTGYYQTEREAAIQVDKVRMCRGLEPVNIFKPKKII